MIENLTVSEVHHQGLLSVLKNTANMQITSKLKYLEKCFLSVTNTYLYDKNVPLRPEVLVPTVMSSQRFANNVVQVKTIRFGASFLLLMKSLQVIDRSTGPSNEQSNTTPSNHRNNYHVTLTLCYLCCRLSRTRQPTHSLFSWGMSKEAAMFISVGRQCRWWLWEWGRMVFAWK